MAPAPLMPKLGRVVASVVRSRAAERRRVVVPALVVRGGAVDVDHAAEHVQERSEHISDRNGRN